MVCEKCIDKIEYLICLDRKNLSSSLQQIISDLDMEILQIQDPLQKKRLHNHILKIRTILEQYRINRSF
jgi:hypothetical protein